MPTSRLACRGSVMCFTRCVSRGSRLCASRPPDQAAPGRRSHDFPDNGKYNPPYTGEYRSPTSRQAGAGMTTVSDLVASFVGQAHQGRRPGLIWPPAPPAGWQQSPPAASPQQHPAPPDTCTFSSADAHALCFVTCNKFLTTKTHHWHLSGTSPTHHHKDTLPPTVSSQQNRFDASTGVAGKPSPREVSQGDMACSPSGQARSEPDADTRSSITPWERSEGARALELAEHVVVGRQALGPGVFDAHVVRARLFSSAPHEVAVRSSN